jgi:hypothetical protein
MSEEKKGEASGIPVDLTDWNSHMDLLSDVVQLPIGPDDGAKDVALAGYVAPTYENGVANGFVGTEEEWNELVAKHRAEAPKEGYIEQMVVETHTPESFGELLKEMTTPKEGEDTATLAVGTITAISPEEQGVAIAKAALGEPCIGHFLLLDEDGKPAEVESFASSTKEANLASKFSSALSGMTSLDQIFPIRTAHPNDPLPGWAQSLIKFYNLAVSDFQSDKLTVDPRTGLSFPSDLQIFRYAGMDGDQEVTWFRFQLGDQSRSFVVLSKDVPTFLGQMTEENPMEWTHKRRASAKGFGLNVTQAPIELPLSFFPFSFAKDPIDDLFDGDFTQVKEVCERLNEDLRGRLGELNRIALKLADLIPQKDHDLYLSFKGVNGLKEMNVALDRVYPKLPESGEIVLGDEPINIFEWSAYSKVVQVNVKRISHGTRQINRMFDKYRALINPHPMIQEIFDTNLKEQLMASSHFLNRVYGFSAAYGVKYMEEVANEVISKLNAHGGNIGLDLNEWVVYEYHEEGRPTPIESEELDFKKQILNSYTQSFVDALYGYLLDVQNPYIKPYTYRTVVEGDDGIEVGTIRQV